MAQTNGARNRSAGHAFELVAAKLIEPMFPHVASTRSCNRSRDNEGIDLCNRDELKQGRLPYNIQCKSMASGVSYMTLLNALPKDKGVVNVVFHRYTKGVENKSGKKNFFIQGEFAMTRMVDFVELMKDREALKQLRLQMESLPEDQRALYQPQLTA